MNTAENRRFFFFITFIEMSSTTTTAKKGVFSLQLETYCWIFASFQRGQIE